MSGTYVTFVGSGAGGGGSGTVTLINTTNGVTGGPISNTGTLSVSSISLTGQVFGVLPPANSSGLNLLSGSVSLTNQVVGNLPVTNLNVGSGASAATFWRGDGTWAAPAMGSGSSTGTVTQLNTGAGLFGGPITTTGTISVASVSLVNQVVGNLPLSQTSGSISLTAQVSGNLPLSQTSGSISLTAQVSGSLPLSQTSGSISLTTQVSGNLPLSQTSGSISLTAQVSGILPVANGGSTGTNTGDVTLTAVGSSPSANGASLAGQALTLQPADLTHPGLVTTAAQTFGGTKSFVTTIQSTNTVGSISFSSSASGSIYNLIYPGVLGAVGQTLTAGSGGALSWTTQLVSPMTTSGDLIVGGSAGAAQKLTVGSGAQVLISSAGATNGVAWGTNNFQDATTVSSGYSVQGWATINSFSITTWRTGDRLGGRAYCVPTTASSSTLPAGVIIPFPIDYTKAMIGPTNIVGRCWRLSGGYPSASVGPMPLFISSSSAVIQMSIQGVGAQGTTQSTTGTILGWAGNGIMFEFDNIPIQSWSTWS